mgnify:CR=1 FL=1
MVEAAHVEAALGGERAKATADSALCLLLPQSSTLDDVTVTVELVETHLVLLERSAAVARSSCNRRSASTPRSCSRWGPMMLWR